MEAVARRAQVTSTAAGALAFGEVPQRRPLARTSGLALFVASPPDVHGQPGVRATPSGTLRGPGVSRHASGVRALDRAVPVLPEHPVPLSYVPASSAAQARPALQLSTAAARSALRPAPAAGRDRPVIASAVPPPARSALPPDAPPAWPPSRPTAWGMSTAGRDRPGVLATAPSPARLALHVSAPPAWPGAQPAPRAVPWRGPAAGRDRPATPAERDISGVRVSDVPPGQHPGHTHLRRGRPTALGWPVEEIDSGSHHRPPVSASRITAGEAAPVPVLGPATGPGRPVPLGAVPFPPGPSGSRPPDPLVAGVPVAPSAPPVPPAPLGTTSPNVLQRVIERLADGAAGPIALPDIEIHTAAATVPAVTAPSRPARPRPGQSHDIGDISDIGRIGGTRGVGEHPGIAEPPRRVAPPEATWHEAAQQPGAPASGAPAPSRVSAPTRAPEVDLDALADRVAQRLMGRGRLERERRGWS